jgi:hypothetical protein
VKFSGFDESSTLIGIMGIQDVRDVTLIRHPYVLSVHQGRRIGGALLTFLAEQTTSPLPVWHMGRG